MNEVRLTPEKREELTKWLMEIPGKYCNPILQFIAENEYVEPKPKQDDKETK